MTARRRSASLVRRIVALATVVAMVVPVPAFAVPPTTSCALLPASPDGSNGWYVSEPVVRLTSSQAGSIHYWYDSAPESVIPAVAGVPVQVAAPPEGSSVLRAYAVNSSGETETPIGVERAIHWASWLLPRPATRASATRSPRCPTSPRGRPG